jgi:hypothetical protein
VRNNLYGLFVGGCFDVYIFTGCVEEGYLSRRSFLGGLSIEKDCALVG